MNELDHLAKKYGTDKQIGNHGYTKYYHEHFKNLRDYPLKVLEIGVHMGYSLQMWADYFPKANIWGIDDGSSGDLRTQYDNPRIHFKQGSQINNLFLAELVNEAKEFDIIIDDGSHYSSDIVYTMNYLFSYLKHDGYYVVEDLHCSYSPYTDPGLAHRFNANNKTAMQYLIDAVNALHVDKNHTFDGMSFYKGMCFIKKK